MAPIVPLLDRVATVSTPARAMAVAELWKASSTTVSGGGGGGTYGSEAESEGDTVGSSDLLRGCDCVGVGFEADTDSVLESLGGNDVLEEVDEDVDSVFVELGGAEKVEVMEGVRPLVELLGIDRLILRDGVNTSDAVAKQLTRPSELPPVASF